MKKYFFLWTISLWVACAPAHKYYKDYEFAQKNWAREDTLRFSYTQKSEEMALDLFLNFRHDLTYPYHNVYVLLKTFFPSGEVQTDTIMLYLQDPQTGQYYGKGYTHVLQQDVRLKTKAVQEEGTFHFELFQGMRDSLLQGVHTVGLRLETHAP